MWVSEAMNSGLPVSLLSCIASLLTTEPSPGLSVEWQPLTSNHSSLHTAGGTELETPPFPDESPGKIKNTATEVRSTGHQLVDEESAFWRQ